MLTGWYFTTAIQHKMYLMYLVYLMYGKHFAVKLSKTVAILQTKYWMGIFPA